MGKQKRFHNRYLTFSEKILKKLRYKINAYDREEWTWLKLEMILLVAYHVISIITMGTPTHVSLFLNTVMVFRFIVGNNRENRKVVNKAKESNHEISSGYISTHAIIAIIEAIMAGLMVLMIFWLGVDNNIGQIEFATIVILVISFFEGWKDINVSFFDATPMIF